VFEGDTKARTEDDAVSETWARFLADPEKNWSMPLHIPMAKAALRAMDTLDQYAKKH